MNEFSYGTNKSSDTKEQVIKTVKKSAGIVVGAILGLSVVLCLLYTSPSPRDQ